MWFDGSTATCGMPMNDFRFLAAPANDPTYNATNWKYCYSFMSRHKGGCNFAACDGSVHFVSEQIDFTLYQALATIDGGEASVTSTSNPGTSLPANSPEAAGRFNYGALPGVGAVRLYCSRLRLSQAILTRSVSEVTT